MAKVTIAGQAVVITSTLKLEDIAKVAKYRPKALKLFGGEDGKDEIFAIGISNGDGSIGNFGASFGHENGNGYAILTMIHNCEDDEDAKEYIADTIGGALINLGKLEESLPGIVSEINAERAAIMEGITVAQ